MKKYSAITFLAVSFILIFPFVFSLIYPWTDIQCRKEHIDINTGISRTQKYYWFLKYSEKNKPTYLSELLGVVSVENPQWHKVNTLSFGHRNSPNYSFHGAFSQISELKLMISLYNLNKDDSRTIAHQVIKLWKENQSNRKANKYLYEINMQYGKDL